MGGLDIGPRIRKSPYNNFSKSLMEVQSLFYVDILGIIGLLSMSSLWACGLSFHVANCKSVFDALDGNNKELVLKDKLPPQVSCASTPETVLKPHQLFGENS